MFVRCRVLHPVDFDPIPRLRSRCRLSSAKETPYLLPLATSARKRAQQPLDSDVEPHDLRLVHPRNPRCAPHPLGAERRGRRRFAKKVRAPVKGCLLHLLMPGVCSIPGALGGLPAP
jgi:hypothetical protein